MFGFIRRPRPDRWDPSAPLLHWSRHDPFTVGHALEGTLVTGATGSGKTSGSGRAVAGAFLRAGFGGLVLTAKPDERATWERYCRDAGRAADLVVFGPGEPWRFNFLDYEAARPGAGAGLTENLVALFTTVLEMAERGGGPGGGGGREDEGYWRRANRQLCRNAVDLLLLAAGRVGIPDLYRAVVSAPTSPEQVAGDAWRRSSACFGWLAEADARPKSDAQRRDLELVSDYFLLEFAGLSDKTRSSIVSTFTSMVDVLNRGLLRELFCTGTNLTPDAVAAGKIVLLDLPVKEFAEVGTIGQGIFKYLFQRSVERRDVRADPRPVFLWQDEAQHFVTSHDPSFQATCRSARVATVALTQNVSGFHAALGGDQRGKALADALFANLNTKLFHANSDPATNEWASSILGKSLQLHMNGSTSHGQDDGGIWGGLADGCRSQSTGGFSEQMDYDLQPSAFTTLATGGPANRFQVEGVLYQNGRAFAAAGGRTWMRVGFAQRG